LNGTGCSRRTQYDANGNPHSFTYDSAGARTHLIAPLNCRTTSAYDATGQQNFRNMWEMEARTNGLRIPCAWSDWQSRSLHQLAALVPPGRYINPRR